LCLVVLMAAGMASYQLISLKATQYLRLGRDTWELMLNHFRALTEGTKELKLHRERLQAFFARQLEPTAVSLRKLYIVGMSMYSAAGSWAQILFFSLLGILIFFIPGVTSID